MDSSIKQLQEEISAIKRRNQKVEQDKAWETSGTRKVSIVFITYIVASAVMYCIGVEKFLLNAVIPTVGYTLSTLSLSFLKNWWVEKFTK